MRISQAKLNKIHQQILTDLYEKPEEALDKRREEIANLSRLEDLKPIQHLLDQLPEDMIAKCTEFKVVIKYKPTAIDGEYEVDEVWEYDPEGNELFIAPVRFIANHNGARAAPVEARLNPYLRQKAAELCEDIIALRKEKNELDTFLDTTTDAYTTTKQFKQVWPEALHKYIPAEVARAPRKAPIDVAASPQAPSTIQERLTTNLLEDD